MRSIGKTLVKAASNKAQISFSPNERPSIFSALNRGGEARRQMMAMGSVGTLFAIVNANSESLAGVRWRLWNKSLSGKDLDRTENTRHLALKVWNKPNPFYTQQELVEAFAQHLDLTGEGWLFVKRNSRLKWPEELWVVRPDRMTPIPHPTKFLSGYVYSSPDGTKVPLELNEIMQLRTPNPLDPYRGMGAVQSILTDLDATTYSAEWNRNFFINNAEPGGVIEITEDIGDEEYRQLKQRWNEQHQGLANAHRVAILTAGKWVDRKFSMRDMQFAELRNVSREVIREAFRFPKAMLGTIDDVNRANAEANELIFARWLIKPRLDRIKAMLNSEFLPMFFPPGVEPDVEFDYDDPSPDDQELELKALEAKSSAAKVLVDTGWDPADVLAVVGLPDMDFVGPTAPSPQATPALPSGGEAA